MVHNSFEELYGAGLKYMGARVHLAAFSVKLFINGNLVKTVVCDVNHLVSFKMFSNHFLKPRNPLLLKWKLNPCVVLLSVISFIFLFLFPFLPGVQCLKMVLICSGSDLG